MIPLWRPLVATALATLLAMPFDRVIPLGPKGTLSRWPLLALATLLGCYLLFAVPVLAAIVGLCLGARAVTSRDRALAPSSGDAAPVAALATAGAAFLVAILAARPSTPCFWDAFVWLGKARFAAAGLGQLIAGGLRETVPPFIPQGYPLFEPLLVAILGGFSSRPQAVVAGAIGLELLVTALFLCVLAEADHPSPAARRVRIATVAFVLLTSPLVLVHLRSSYVDLPLGLLVATLAVLLPRPRTGLACAVVAMSAAALKDEGMVHVAVIAAGGVAWAITLRGPRARELATRAVVAGLAAAAVMGAWRVRLLLAGVATIDHAMSLPDWQRARPLLGLILEHVTDVRSWGGLWVLGVGAALAALVRPQTAPRDAVWFASVLVADGVVMFVALLATPERVMEFASGGSLLNRLGMQLVPIAAILVAAWRTQPSTDGLGSDEGSPFLPIGSTAPMAKRR